MDGEVWVVTDQRTAQHRTGVTEWDGAGNGWEEVEANLIHIDVGDCQVCGITPNHEIMCISNIGGSENKKGDDWQQIRGQLSDISVGYGPVLWGVDYGHNVWYK